MKHSGSPRSLAVFLLLYALCLIWILAEPEIRYLVWEYTAHTFDVLSRRRFLFAGYLGYGVLLAVRSRLSRQLFSSLWWVHGLCLTGALALYTAQRYEVVYPFLSLSLDAQRLVDCIAAFRQRKA